MAASREKEIEQIFAKNPELLNRSPRQLALYFYIQGELSSSHTREISSMKAAFYRHRLGIENPDLQKECDEVLENLIREARHLEVVK